MKHIYNKIIPYQPIVGEGISQPTAQFIEKKKIGTVVSGVYCFYF